MNNIYFIVLKVIIFKDLDILIVEYNIKLVFWKILIRYNKNKGRKIICVLKKKWGKIL